jgi:DNA-directed RNA polymerase III subunit RPC8
LADTITQEVDRKYSNKIIIDIGLCICLHHCESIGDAHIYQSDGCAHNEVVFRLLVFRPFVGEILIGKISVSSEEGLKVSLGFFEDICIPPYMLPQPSHFDAIEKSWVWTYDDARYQLVNGEDIRFRVSQLQYTRPSITKKAATAADNDVNGQPRRNKTTTSLDLTMSEPAPAALKIVGDIRDQGFGHLSWW